MTRSGEAWREGWRVAVTQDERFRQFVEDQLTELRGLRSKAMFGGYGLYADDAFFGIIFKGRLYFKTNARTRPAYVRQGMKPFRPSAKQTLKSYYEVPVDVLESGDTLTQWAHGALSVERKEIE